MEELVRLLMSRDKIDRDIAIGRIRETEDEISLCPENAEYIVREYLDISISDYECR